MTIHLHLEPMLRMSGGTALLPPHVFMAWAWVALPSPSPHIGFLLPYIFIDHICNIRYQAHQFTVAEMSAEYHVLNYNLYYIHISCTGTDSAFTLRIYFFVHTNETY